MTQTINLSMLYILLLMLIIPGFLCTQSPMTLGQDNPVKLPSIKNTDTNL